MYHYNPLHTNLEATSSYFHNNKIILYTLHLNCTKVRVFLCELISYIERVFVE